MVERWWRKLANKFSTVALDKHVVMPNHFHRTIIIAVTAPLKAAPVEAAAPEPQEELAPVFTFTPTEVPGRQQIRFAEDILGPRSERGSKSKKKKKKAFGKEKEDGIKLRNARRDTVGEVVVKDEEEF
jgi:hypothetical protein